MFQKFVVPLDGSQMGKAVAGITTTGAERGADLVIMATLGRTGLQRARLGSVAGDVPRNGTTPLLLVHPATVPRQAARPPFVS